MQNLSNEFGEIDIIVYHPVLCAEAADVNHLRKLANAYSLNGTTILVAIMSTKINPATGSTDLLYKELEMTLEFLRDIDDDTLINFLLEYTK